MTYEDRPGWHLLLVMLLMSVVIVVLAPLALLDRLVNGSVERRSPSHR